MSASIICVLLFSGILVSPAWARLVVTNIDGTYNSMWVSHHNGRRSRSNNANLIFNLGFAKTGTTTMSSFLTCVGIEGVTHWQCNRKQTCGLCFSIAMVKNMSIPEACGHEYVAHTEINEVQRCIFPQLSHLDFLVTKHPDAKFTLIYREASAWIRSARNYGSADILFLRCYLRSGQPIPQAAKVGLSRLNVSIATIRRGHGITREIYDAVQADNLLMRWYDNQYSIIRNFFSKRLSVAFFFSNLTSPALESGLRRFLNASVNDSDDVSYNKQCWGHANRNLKTQS